MSVYNGYVKKASLLHITANLDGLCEAARSRNARCPPASFSFMNAESLGFRVLDTQVPLFERVALDVHLAFRVLGLGEREKDKDMVNVGVRRRSRSPPYIGIGGSLAKPQPLQCCLGLNCPITGCRVVEPRITSCRVVVASGHVLLISGCCI